jgi:ribosomal protein S18 acetylase RimI-like enzyme
MHPILPISEAHIESYHQCLDIICREGRYLGSLQAPPLEKSRAFVREQIEDHRLMFVALDNAQVIGWCDISPLSRSILAHRGELGMGVHPDHRRKGLGRRLIRTALQAARESGLEQVELSVRTDNAAAITLYGQEGFRNCGLTPRAIEIHHDYFDCASMYLIL